MHSDAALFRREPEPLSRLTATAPLRRGARASCAERLHKKGAGFCNRTLRPSTKAEFPKREARPLQYKEVVQKEREGLSEALHVLNSSDEEGLLAHIGDAEHASSAEAMVLFTLRKGSFNYLLAPPVDPFANRCPGEECDIIQSILPNMPRHHPSCRFAAEALFPHRALGTFLWVAEILPVTLSCGRLPVKRFFGGAEICVKI